MPFIIWFSILYIMWIFLSGKLDMLHLSMGVISAALISYLNYKSFKLGNLRSLFKNFKNKVAIFFLSYIPWLMYQIVSANFHVAYLVLHPNMPIEPEIVKFKTMLKDDTSLTIFGNSITLTPGTITIDIEEGEIYVHVLSSKSKAELLSGKMEQKIAKIYKNS